MATKKKSKSKTAPVKKEKVLTVEEQEVAAAKLKAKEADKEAKKLLKEAEAVATKQKKAAEKKKAKEKLAAAETAKQTATLRSLKTDAKEINVRMDKAAKLMGDADDHRLAAALKMAQAKTQCRTVKINYEDWCKENVKLGYESIRKLLPVGAAEDGEKGAGRLMLADMRNKNKAANKKSRDKKKAAATGTSNKEPAPRKRTIFERVDEAVSGASDKDVEAVANKIIGKEKRIVSASDVKELRKLKEGKTSTSTPREEAEDAFDRLGAKAKIAFATWAAGQIGATISKPKGAGSDNPSGDGEDGQGIPDKLKRS